MKSAPPVFHAQPVEPMMVHAIEEYLKTNHPNFDRVTEFLLSVCKLNNSQITGTAFDTLILLAFLGKRGTELTDLLRDLATDGSRIPNWVKGYKLISNTIVSDLQLNEFLRFASDSHSTHFPNVYSESRWLEVAALVENVAGTDGVMIAEKEGKEPLLISFSNAVYKDGVTKEKVDKQDVKVDLANQYLKEVTEESLKTPSKGKGTPKKMKKDEDGDYEPPGQKKMVYVPLPDYQVVVLETY